jgi:hypothetical protein
MLEKSQLLKAKYCLTTAFFNPLSKCFLHLELDIEHIKSNLRFSHTKYSLFLFRSISNQPFQEGNNGAIFFIGFNDDHHLLCEFYFSNLINPGAIISHVFRRTESQKKRSLEQRDTFFSICELFQ